MKQTMKMTEGSLADKIFFFALPLAASSILQLLEPMVQSSTFLSIPLLVYQLAVMLSLQHLLVKIKKRKPSRLSIHQCFLLLFLVLS